MDDIGNKEMCGNIKIGKQEFYVLKKKDLQYAKEVREEKLKECMFHAHNSALPLDQQLEFKERAEKLKKEIRGIEQLLTLPLDMAIFIELSLLSPLAE